MDDVFNLQYKNPEINRLLKIYRRTKNSRIKNKLYKRIFGLCLDEKGVIILEDVVVMKYSIYKELVEVTKMTGVVTDKSNETYAMSLR